jgi:hypothetical protein
MSFTPLSPTPSSGPTPSFTPLSSLPTPSAAAAPAPQPNLLQKVGGFLNNTVVQPIKDQFAAGQQQIDQPYIEKGSSPSGFTPLQAAEGALSVGSGVVTKLTAPLAPALGLLNKAIEYIGTKNEQFAQKTDPTLEKWAASPAGAQAIRAVQDIANAANVAGAVVGGAEAFKGEAAPPTPETAAQQYHQQVLAPAKEAGQPVILDSDAVKTANGNDYNPQTHPIYSQATKQLFEQEVPTNPHPVVKFTAGGPGSGKSDFLLPSMSKDFNGVIYDSTLSDYKTLQNRLATVKAAGKTPDVYGIIPDLEKARSFTQSRAAETGRAVPTDFFDKTHAGVINTLGKALENGDLTPEQVHLMDTRNMSSADVVRAAFQANRYATDPLALLKDAGYNKDNGQAPTGNELVPGGRNEPLPVSRESGPNQGQSANDAGGSNQVLQRASNGTGSSRIGRSIEQKAVEAKLTQGFDKTAGYDPITIKDQAERATKLLNESPDDARAVLRGEKPLPEGLRGTALITAAEEHLKANPDPQLAYELANSPLTSATSAAAQEMRLMSERVPDSITAKFNEIKAAREAALEKQGGVKKAVKKITEDIQKEIRTTASKRPSWEEFTRQLTCNS